MSRDVIFSGQLIYAQNPFLEPACSNLLPTVGDLNGDGLPDLAFLPIRSNTLTVMKSVGRWAWSEPEVAFDFGPDAIVLDASLADMDSDGDEDVVYFVSSAGSVFVGTLLAEDGDLVPVISAHLAGTTSGYGFWCDSPHDRVEVIDITGDGALDVVVAASDLMLAVGAGDGTFDDIEIVGDEHGSSLAATDRVPGNRMEVFLGSGDSILIYEYIFPEGSPITLPHGPSIDPVATDIPGPEPSWRIVEQINLYQLEGIDEIEAIDLNDDGLPDLVCVSEQANIVLPLLQDPILGDVVAPVIEFFNPSSLVVADFDSDALPDLAIGSGRVESGSNLFDDTITLGYAKGLGGGDFEFSGVRWALPYAADRVVAHDLDLDGDLDLIAGEGRGITFLENRSGAGVAPFENQRRFAKSGETSFTNIGFTRIVTGDFNNDGRKDVGLVDSHDDLRISTQQPDETFETGDVVAFAGSGGARPVAVDVDGDGNLDIAVGISQNPQIAYGIGDSTFELPVSISPPDGAGFNGPRLTLALGHFNDDSLLDLVTADEQTSYLFLQEPQTRAFGTGIVVGPGACLITIADMDSDGIDDVVAANGGNSYGCPDDAGADSWIAFMDGQGGLREIRSFEQLGPFDSVAVADENNDGYLDVLGGLYGFDWYRVAHGDGEGGFMSSAEVVLPLTDTADDDTGKFWANRFEVTDLNGDGVTDVCVLADKNIYASHYPRTERVHVVLGGAQGGDRLVCVVEVPPDIHHLRDFVLTDLDGDGSPEIVTPASRAVLDTNASWPRYYPGFCITPGLVRPIDRCPADLADPTGLLDLADVLAFAMGFQGGDITADPAPPFGTFDLADIVTFVETFLAGCP